MLVKKARERKIIHHNFNLNHSKKTKTMEKIAIIVYVTIVLLVTECNDTRRTFCKNEFSGKRNGS